MLVAGQKVVIEAIVQGEPMGPLDDALVCVRIAGGLSWYARCAELREAPIRVGDFVMRRGDLEAGSAGPVFEVSALTSPAQLACLGPCLWGAVSTLVAVAVPPADASLGPAPQAVPRGAPPRP